MGVVSTGQSARGDMWNGLKARHPHLGGEATKFGRRVAQWQAEIELCAGGENLTRGIKLRAPWKRGFERNPAQQSSNAGRLGLMSDIRGAVHTQSCPLITMPRNHIGLVV